MQFSPVALSVGNEVGWHHGVFLPVTTAEQCIVSVLASAPESLKILNIVTLIAEMYIFI